jgi:hypothetical protein
MSREMSRQHLRWLALSLATLGIVLYVVQARAAVFHALPRLQPDSASYLEASVARTPVYPLLLKTLSYLPGGLDWLGPFQHATFLLTGLVLAYQFARTFGHPLLAIALALTILANPALASYCFTILPEALFVTVLMVHLAFVVALARGWRRATVVGIGTTAAILVLVKPAGYAVVAGLAIIALAWRGHWRTFHWLIGPAMALLLAACAANYAVRGVFATQAQGGYSRLTYIGHLLDESTAAAHGEVTRRVARQTAPIGRALEQLPAPTIYYALASNECQAVDTILRREMAAELRRAHGGTVVDDRAFASDALVLALNRLGGPLADDIVRAHPVAYGRHVALNLFGLWWLPLIQDRGSLPALHADIDDQLTRHPVLDRSPIPFRALPWPAFLAVRTLLLAILVCGIAGPVFLWSRRPERRLVGYVAAVLNGYFVLVSAVQPGLPRYAVAAWPASMLLLVSTVAVVSALRDPR